MEKSTFLLIRQKLSDHKLFFTLVLFAQLFFSSQEMRAQLSDLHYLPPLKMAERNNIFDAQAVYLSTPESTVFDVLVYRGTNPIPVATVTVANTVPGIYNLPGDDNNITMVSEANTGVVLQNSGLRFESEGGQLFYVSFRGNSSSQGESLTSKGRAALGTNFKWGGIPTVDTSSRNSNHNSTLGIMASEDGTTVTISNYDPGVSFRLGNDIGGITDDSITIILNANETFVLEAAMFGNPINRSGTLGASIVSNNPIVVSNGNLLLGRIQGENQQDAGMDQTVPIDRLGREYIFMRGQGRDALEFPVIIATENNTRIFINDQVDPIATLNEGEFIEIDGSNYGATGSPGDNLYVNASKIVYAYQLTAGADAFPNLGMNFISPVSCLMPRTVDNIALINELPSISVTGGITLLASTSTPEANIVVTDGTGTVALPAPTAVLGTDEWKTYFIPGLTGNVSVNSSGPISVGYIGQNDLIGTASYFSGFDEVPVVDFMFGDGLTPSCLGDTVFVVAMYDGYQWYQNGELVEGATDPEFTPTEIGEVYVEVVSGIVEGEGCLFDSNNIDVYYCDPEIVLNKTVDREQVEVGDTVTFTIAVQSLGVADVTNLTIEDSFPNGLTLIDAVPTKGTWVSPNWTVGTLTAGELQSIVITASVDSPMPNQDSNILINTAFNTQDQIDGNVEPDDPTAIVIVGNDNDNDGIDNDIDLDDDNDGILDIDETDADDDGDGINNEVDLDSDNDGIPDIIEAGGIDENGDGRVDYPVEGNPRSMVDDNSNGVDDNIEANPLEDPDADNDGVNDRLDLDSDNDGISDTTEAGGEDANGNGLIDGFTDIDNDGLSDNVEVNPLPNPDSDDDGNNDRLDIDSDNDGLPDNVEAQSTFDYVSPSDVFGINGLDTSYIETLNAIDTDGDNIPDYLDTDSDNDGINDNIEGGQGTLMGSDTDGDGLDDGFEGNVVNDPYDVNDEIADPTLLPDVQLPGGDVDFRQGEDSDTDGDGVTDGQEILDETDFEDPCDFLESSMTLEQTGDFLTTDCDGDLISNRQEIIDGTDPFDPCDSIGGTPPTGVVCDSDVNIDVLIDNESIGPQIDEGFFRITNIESFPGNSFKVFNRWGVVVFETANYINGSNDFRGVSKGRATLNQDDELPSGVYFYILEYTRENTPQTKKGYLYVVR